MVEPYYIKDVQKQLFAGVLQNRCFEKLAKFIGKHLCWSHFLLKLHMCFPIIFVKFSRTPISQSLFKIKQRLCVNKLAK